MNRRQLLKGLAALPVAGAAVAAAASMPEPEVEDQTWTAMDDIYPPQRGPYLEYTIRGTTAEGWEYKSTRRIEGNESEGCITLEGVPPGAYWVESRMCNGSPFPFHGLSFEVVPTERIG